MAPSQIGSQIIAPALAKQAPGTAAPTVSNATPRPSTVTAPAPAPVFRDTSTNDASYSPISPLTERPAYSTPRISIPTNVQQTLVKGGTSTPIRLGDNTQAPREIPEATSGDMDVNLPTVAPAPRGQGQVTTRGVQRARGDRMGAQITTAGGGNLRIDQNQGEAPSREQLAATDPNSALMTQEARDQFEVDRVANEAAYAKRIQDEEAYRQQQAGNSPGAQKLRREANIAAQRRQRDAGQLQTVETEAAALAKELQSPNMVYDPNLGQKMARLKALTEHAARLRAQEPTAGGVSQQGLSTAPVEGSGVGVSRQGLASTTPPAKTLGDRTDSWTSQESGATRWLKQEDKSGIGLPMSEVFGGGGPDDTNKDGDADDAAAVSRIYGISEAAAQKLIEANWKFRADGGGATKDAAHSWSSSDTTAFGKDIINMADRGSAGAKAAGSSPEFAADFTNAQSTATTEEETQKTADAVAAKSKVLEELIAKPIDISGLRDNWNKSIAAAQRSSARNKALSLRAMQERAAASGSSVNQLMGSTAEAGYAYDTEAANREAMMRLQQAEAETRESVRQSEQKLAAAQQLLSIAANADQAARAQQAVSAAQADSNRYNMAMQAIQAEMNSPSTGMMAAKLGVGVLGAVLAPYTGGASLVAAGAAGAAMGNGTPSVPNYSSQLYSPALQQRAPAPGYASDFTYSTGYRPGVPPGYGPTLGG